MMRPGFAAEPESAAEPQALQHARNVGIEARAGGRAYVVLFGTRDCPWCARVRREVLLPLQRNPEDARRVLIREIDLESGAALVDFNGVRTTHAEFARSRGVNFMPVIAFFAPDGSETAERLVGYRTPDYYGVYLDRRIEASRAARSR